jgi:hypothetical protein
MDKYNVIYFQQNVKNEISAETLDEALSICVALFDQNCELHEIQENGNCLYLCCEIYNLIKRASY